jgi:hypothetical protein
MSRQYLPQPPQRPRGGPGGGERNLNAHGADWCEREAERIYEISVDSFCQTVMPNLQQQGWQRHHLEWEFKLSEEPAEVERTVIDEAINAMETFLRSDEVQRLFIKELVQGTFAEAMQNPLRSMGIRYLIEDELGLPEGSTRGSARPDGRTASGGCRW